MVNKPPSRIHAGDSAAWLVNFPEYRPDQGWVLAYRLSNQSASYVVNAQALGDDFEVKITATQSRSFTAGKYTLIGYVTKVATDERVVVSETSLEVNPDITQAIDRRSQAERTLEAVRALLEGKANEDQQMLQYNGRTLSRYTISDLLTFESRLARTVAREKSRKAGQKGFIGVRI